MRENNTWSRTFLFPIFPDATRYNNAKLCLIILTCIAEVWTCAVWLYVSCLSCCNCENCNLFHISDGLVTVVRSTIYFTFMMFCLVTIVRSAIFCVRTAIYLTFMKFLSFYSWNNCNLSLISDVLSGYSCKNQFISCFCFFVLLLYELQVVSVVFPANFVCHRMAILLVLG